MATEHEEHGEYLLEQLLKEATRTTDAIAALHRRLTTGLFVIAILLILLLINTSYYTITFE